MKKQILVLSMCLALTSTVALAQGAVPPIQKQVPQAKTVPTPVVNPVEVKPDAKSGVQRKVLTKEEAKKYFEERQAKKRDFMAKYLGLSEEQKVKADELDLKAKSDIEKTFKKVQIEGKKLKDLKTQKASKFAVWKQEMTFNSAKKEFKASLDKSRKDFEAILTKEQKIKLKEMKEFQKSHGHKRPKGKGRQGLHGPEHMGPPPMEGQPSMAPPSEKK